uniref:TIGR02646 family protein n=1 Tax=Candidatus Kentrum sp. MB TaxID=2138164 RepID=A0A451BAS0_9GAMM|nr:MAG: hypothetical protein BECKMB1821G_GA0114241_102417 [Candidatus Kentron sp. MB]VFK31189.1 MAG: hypothetical protein BECKMB1821I_GA0114274_102116 [Candidatus Kentron sp. MB]VFK75383.1 MAG: hypothetical protein BECKMB1821H_GA0114242_102117 [Candidatus Kentron sp. MB]
MIPVTLQPEPENFDVLVRQPGRRYLETVRKRNATPKFKGRNKHWKKASGALRKAYKRICAYTCVYLPQSPNSESDSGSADHFLPKSLYPELAYEWNNFRLAQSKVNSHKGDSTDVLDPFQVEAGWFVLDFPSCLVKAGLQLPQPMMDRINRTIDILKLNDDDTFVDRRYEIMSAYSDGEIALSSLEKRYPFLAVEIVRQGIEETASTLFKRRTMLSDHNAH